MILVIMQKIIEFINPSGLTLRGILESPSESRKVSKKNLVVFPNCGLMGIEGDFRAYIRISRILREAGYYVLRFNPHGIGNSDGLIDDCVQKNLFGLIESGLFVDDIKSAVEFAVSELSPDSITICGICGGAISAFLAATELDNVKQVIPISIPIVLDSEQINYDFRMNKSEAKFVLGTYWHKLLSLKAWGRLLKGKSDFKTISVALSKISSFDAESKNTQDKVGNNINPYFLEAFKLNTNNNSKILFIFGTSDRFWWEFEDYYIKSNLYKGSKMPFDYYLVKEGNHMMTWVEWQADVGNKIVSWLDEPLPVQLKRI